MFRGLGCDGRQGNLLLPQRCMQRLLAQQLLVLLSQMPSHLGGLTAPDRRDDAMHAELERLLLFTPPSEILVTTPCSPETLRLLLHCAARGAGGGARGAQLERVEGGKYGVGGGGALASALQGFTGEAAEHLLGLPPLTLRAFAHAMVCGGEGGV